MENPNQIRSHRITHVVATLLAWMGPSAALAEPPERPVFVGVVEDAVVDQERQPHRTIVHVTFQKPSTGTGTEWLPVSPTHPSRLQWNVCLHGRTLGHLTSRPQARAQPDHEPIDGQAVPFVGQPSFAFAGWMGGKVLRPLVLASQQCRDPERWHPRALPPGLLHKLRLPMREATKSIYDCDAEGVHHPYEYSDDDIVVGESFGSDAGTRIVSLSIRLPADLAGRCGVISGPAWQPNTFVVFSDGRIRHLGSGMKFLDAADFDADGHSEVLFQTGGYDRGGYALAYQGFEKLARYDFSYH